MSWGNFDWIVDMCIHAERLLVGIVGDNSGASSPPWPIGGILSTASSSWPTAHIRVSEYMGGAWTCVISMPILTPSPLPLIILHVSSLLSASCKFCRVFILFPIPLYVSLLFPICSSSHNKISNTPLSLLVSNPPPRSLQVVGARTRLHLKPLKSFSSSAHSKSVLPSPRLSQSLQGAGAKTHYISNHFIFHPFSSSTHN